MAVDLSHVRVGDQLFCTGRTATFGSVRSVEATKGFLDGWIENHGDVAIATDWIHAIHDGKVELDRSKLPLNLQQAIDHAHDRESG